MDPRDAVGIKHGRALRALLVESDDAHARLVQSLIAESGGGAFALDWLTSYRSALDVLGREALDVVVLALPVRDDVGAPLASVSLLQRVAPSASIVVLFEQEDAILAAQLLRAGVQDALVKSEIEGPLLVRALRYAVERRRTERELRLSEERFALAVKGSSDGIWDWDLLRGQFYASERWKAIVGYESTADFSDVASWFRRIHSEERERVQLALKDHLHGESEQFETEHRLLHRDGRYRWVLSRGVAQRDDEGRAMRLAGSLSDITHRKRVEERLQYDALHDGLTGLANRALFVERLSTAMAQARRDPTRYFAVLFLDLDRFKNINDSLGHALGDQLLVAIARRLELLLRPSDRVARIGGDEFAILADSLADQRDATRIAVRVLRELSFPFGVEGREVFTSASVGITTFVASYAEPNEMLRDADIAMYRAKADGGNGYQVFDPEMHARAVNLLQLETDLRGALDRDELCLMYQPIVDLRDGGIDGFEVLVRWQHPVRGLLVPEEFVPLAEETGIIYSIGRWVLREACLRAADWRRRFPGREPPSISVNLSGKELIQRDLLRRVSRYLEESGLEANRLRLEITESVVMEHSETALPQLQRLRDLGVKLHLDDFGTGYCSLSYLQRIPTDTLKIDRSFVREITSKESTPPIIEAILWLAGRLGIEVLAEGVETREQLSHLRRLDCRYGQGFLFSEALTAEQAEALIEERHQFLVYPRSDGGAALVG